MPKHFFPKRILGSLLSIVVLFAIGSTMGTAADAASKISSIPDALGAKALLEDLLVRRYSQALATKLDKSNFTIGAELELKQIPPAVKPNVTPAQPEPISDLMLGTLDPEALLKGSSGTDEKLAVQGLLSNYKIRGVNISVGLKSSVSADTKTDVEKWLKNRLSQEFGALAKGSVTTIAIDLPKKEEKPPEISKPAEPKTPLEYAQQFQALIGQLALALAFVMGVILYRLFGSKEGSGANADPANSTSSAASTTGALGAGAKASAEGSATAGGSGKDSTADSEAGSADGTLATPEQRARTKDLTAKISEISSQVAPDLEKIIRAWSQLGEEGYLKLACFAEAVGKDMGKLPVPVDAMSETARAFAKMPEVSASDRNNILQKVYWDLMSAINLGPDILSRPFGYLGALNVDAIRNALIEENPRMRTLVALHMPNSLRGDYVKSLPSEKKKDLLLAALELAEVPLSEVKTLDASVRNRLKPVSSSETVDFGMTIEKIVSVLPLVESLTLLKEIDGPKLLSFKRSVPLLAFLDQWPDDKLSILLSRAGPDEIMALIRVRPDLKEQLLRLSPELTVEMIRDEIDKPDRISESEKGQWLSVMAKRVEEMIKLKEASLDEIFPIAASSPSGSSDSPDSPKLAA